MPAAARYLFILGTFALLPASGAPADPPAATRPAAATTPEARAQRIRQALAALGDSDPVARDQAYAQLVSLTLDDLPLLRDAVARARPLQASQLAVLRPVVTHVWLTAQPYRPAAEGFLGVVLPPFAAADVNELEGESPVIVVDRIPGFCGYAALRDGDVLLEIEEAARLRNKYDLIAVVKATAPGDLIHLRVSRQGRVLRVAARLDARPVEATGANAEAQMEGFKNARAKAAADYWDATFAPLVPAPAAAATADR